MKFDKIVRTAECSCGQISLCCTGEPEQTSIGHCFEYQKLTGSVFGVHARFNKNQLKFIGELASYTRLTESGHHIHYQFCPKCSTTVLISFSTLSDTLIIPSGVFKQQDLPKSSFSVYEQRQHQWVKFECQI